MARSAHSDGEATPMQRLPANRARRVLRTTWMLCSRQEQQRHNGGTEGFCCDALHVVHHVWLAPLTTVNVDSICVGMFIIMPHVGGAAQ